MAQVVAPCIMVHILESEEAERRDRPLDVQVWSDLSEDLVRRVMLLMSYDNQSRFRSISKVWLEILSSSAFVQESEYVRAQLGYSSSPICVYELIPKKPIPPPEGNRGDPHTADDDEKAEMGRRLSCKFGSSSTQLVHSISLDFLPSFVRGDKKVVTRDGLILIYPQDQNMRRNRGLLVANPITRTWMNIPSGTEQLPDEEQFTPIKYEVMVDRTCLSHFLAYSIMSSSELDKWYICRFSSKTNQWICVQGEGAARHKNSRVYLSTNFLHFWLEGEISSYALTSGKLLTTSTPGHPAPPPGLEVSANQRLQFVERKGRVYALLALRSEVGRVIGVSRLSREVLDRDPVKRVDARWEELVLMPEDIAFSPRMRKLAEDNKWNIWSFHNFHASVLGDYICFKLLYKNFNTKSKVSQSVVGYHIPSNTWRNFDAYVPPVQRGVLVEICAPVCTDVFLNRVE